LKKEISDQIAKVVANSPEDFDTLKEISDWISGHSSDATSMNSAISGNTSAINQEILDRQAADTALQTNIDNKADKDLSNVTVVLPISKGGTGATTDKEAEYNLFNSIPVSDEAYTDNTSFNCIKSVRSNATGVFTSKKASGLWTYIKDKISSILGLTSTNYGGKAATAGTADTAKACSGNAATATKATQDGSGNNIVNTYAIKSETPKTGTFTMVGLGFTKDDTISVRDFAKTIVSKYGSAGMLCCNWETAKQGFVGSSTNRVLLSGGILLFTAKGTLNNAWDEFTALYTSKANNKTTLIACSIGQDATVGAEDWTVVDYLRSTDIDSSLSSTSTKPVQNKVVNAALGNKVDKNSRITIPATTDLNLSSFGEEPLSIGTKTGENIGIDTNEIQARKNGAASELYINTDGGKTYIGKTNDSSSGLVVRGRLTIPTSAPSSPQAGDIWIG
jgi:hypothetical protein